MLLGNTVTLPLTHWHTHTPDAHKSRIIRALGVHTLRDPSWHLGISLTEAEVITMHLPSLDYQVDPKFLIHTIVNAFLLVWTAELMKTVHHLIFSSLNYFISFAWMWTLELAPKFCHKKAIYTYCACNSSSLRPPNFLFRET